MCVVYDLNLLPPKLNDGWEYFRDIKDVALWATTNLTKGYNYLRDYYREVVVFPLSREWRQEFKHSGLALSWK